MKPPLFVIPLVAFLAPPAFAETVTIGFAPPVGVSMLYRIEQVRPMDGRECRFVAERELRFEREGDAYILHATLRRIDADAAPAAADAYRVALSPLLDVEQRFRVDAAGRIVALDNIDAVWAAAEAGLARMVAGFGADTPKHRAAQRVLTLFAGLTAEGRLALLAGELKPLLLFAGTPLVDGDGRGVETVAGSPLGRPVAVRGQVTIAERVGERLTVEEKLTGEGIGVDIQYRLSSVTGLVEEQSRRLTMGAQWLAETRSLTPLQK